MEARARPLSTRLTSGDLGERRTLHRSRGRGVTAWRATLTVQFHVHLSALVIRDIDWPPRAVTLRLIDVDGREVHSKVKGACIRVRATPEIAKAYQ